MGDVVVHNPSNIVAVTQQDKVFIEVWQVAATATSSDDRRGVASKHDVHMVLIMC